MAREGEIAMQYFERLLGEREGRRLVFAEGLWDEPSQLQLLATHLLDASIGESFFGDPLRMHRDCSPTLPRRCSRKDIADVRGGPSRKRPGDRDGIDAG